MKKFALPVNRVEQPVHLLDAAGALQRHLQLGELPQQLFEIWKKFMERWVQETNGDRQSLHRAKDPDEVLALKREELIESFLSRAHAIRQNHLAHRRQPLVAKEHVLGAAQSNALRPELSCHLSVVWGVCV